MKILFLVSLLSAAAIAAESPPAAANVKVQVVCGIDIPNKFRSKSFASLQKPYFEAPVSLAKFAKDISPAGFLDAVAEQTANNYTKDWIGFLSILRWSEADQEYHRVERIRLSDAGAFLGKLQAGDVLAFHGQFCYF